MRSSQMNKGFVVLLMALFFSAVGWAQEGTDVTEKWQKEIDKTSASLNLTADQQEEFQAIEMDYYQQKQQLKDSRKTALQGLLTPEQFAQLEKMEQSQMKKMHESKDMGMEQKQDKAQDGEFTDKGVAKPSVDRPKTQSPTSDWHAQNVEEMATTLDLDPEQRTEFTRIQNDYYNQVQAVRGETTTDKMAAKEALDKLRVDRDAQLKELLTEDQYTSFLERERKMWEKSKVKKDKMKPKQ